MLKPKLKARTLAYIGCRENLYSPVVTKVLSCFGRGITVSECFRLKAETKTPKAPRISSPMPTEVNETRLSSIGERLKINNRRSIACPKTNSLAFVNFS